MTSSAIPSASEEPTSEVREALEAHGELLAFMQTEQAVLAHPVMERAAGALLDAATRLEALERAVKLKPLLDRKLTPEIHAVIEACRFALQEIERHDGDAKVHGRASTRIKHVLKLRDNEVAAGGSQATVEKLMKAGRATLASFDRFPGSLYDKPYDAIKTALRNYAEKNKWGDGSPSRHGISGRGSTTSMASRTYGRF